MTTSPECALFRTMLFLVLIFANMILTTRHGKLLGKYSGPGWNYLDIVFATGKNIKARLCLKKHGDNCHQNDWLEWNRYVIVQKNDPSPLELLEVCYSCSIGFWFYPWRTSQNIWSKDLFPKGTGDHTRMSKKDDQGIWLWRLGKHFFFISMNFSDVCWCVHLKHFAVIVAEEILSSKSAFVGQDKNNYN